MDEAGPPSDRACALRHLRIGWCAIAIFATLGLVLEALHALKLPSYLGAASETRRLLWRLGHAHGTLLGLVNVALGGTIERLPARSPRTTALASFCLAAATVTLPAGFLLGGVAIAGGDPGAAIVLAPVGALFFIAAIALIARQAFGSAPVHDRDAAASAALSEPGAR